jgi:hypothetical protein
MAFGFNSIFPDALGARSSDTSFAMQVGGGVDLRTGKHLFVRAISVNYLRTRLRNGNENTQDILHIGGGLGIKF